MHYPAIKEKALMMRKKGASLGEISKIFNISKSTLSLWFKDIVFSEDSILKIESHGRKKSLQGLLRYSELKRQDRIKRHISQKQNGAQMLGQLSDRDILMIGLGLYWGEGYKYANGELGFTNSNPSMILFYLKWLKLFGINRDSLIFRITLNSVFESQEENIKNFWAKTLGVEKSQFSKTTYVKTVLKKKSFSNIENYKGILRVKVRKGTALRNKILGAIEAIHRI